MLNTILNRATDSIKAETECMSTEEALRGLLECNRRIAAGELGAGARDAVLMSMDVKSLYPSLKKDKVTPIISTTIENLIREGKLEVENVDYYEVGKFLYITKTKTQLEELGIMSAMPERSVGRDARGRKPTPAYWDVDYVTDNSQKSQEGGASARMDKWIKGNPPTVRQAARMVANMIGE